MENETKPSVIVLADEKGTEITDLIVPLVILRESRLFEQVLLVSSSNNNKWITLFPTNIKIESDINIEEASHHQYHYIICPAMKRNNQKKISQFLQDQIKKIERNNGLLISICDGVFCLGHAGLLKGKTATGHWFSLNSRQKQFPNTTWKENQRYVKDGNILTTSGVSASIPSMLYLIELVGGRESALDVCKRFQLNPIWDSNHSSSSFQLEYYKDVLSVVIKNSLVSLFKPVHFEVNLIEGFDELRFALIVDIFSRTFGSSVTVHISQPTLFVLGNSKLRFQGPQSKSWRRGDRIQFDFYKQSTLDDTLNEALDQVEKQFGQATRRFVIKQLEDPIRLLS